MKLIDKFLKMLGASRNTFATYILAVLSIYFCVDRMVEMLLMLFTGVSYSYWGPIMYTIALACPIFAFAFLPSSEFNKDNAVKLSFFYISVIALTIIATSMFTQWMNLGAWFLLVSNPGYVDLVTNFSELIKPALTSITILFPMYITPVVFNFLYFYINDTRDLYKSVQDFGGINLADKKQGHGPYTCDIFMFNDKKKTKKVTFPEISRYSSLFVCGGSGSGKTSLIFEPMIARDLERKFFFKEVSKEMGYTALKTKIAVLNKPYDNDYLNKNFNLNMLSPTAGNESVYKAYMDKMILSSSPDIIYKNCGVTVVSPDREIFDHMISVCKNFGLSYNIIDPLDQESIGVNPFVYDDNNKIALTISSAIKSMLDLSIDESAETYRESVAVQAIENVAMLLKEIYPKMHDGALPNLDDMLQIFNNFDLVEKMCEILAHDEKLKEKYSQQLAYLRKNFYKDGSGRKNTEKYIDPVINQLDRLLRIPGVKTVLCNRHNNINFDKMLSNADVTFVCSRRGALGSSSHTAFGLFFLVSMQNAVLRRPGTEKSRVPNFLYIDEFPDYICRATEPIFTMYRKYKIGTTISAQNLAQLETPHSKKNYRSTILSNCASKIYTGGTVSEEVEWWQHEFGTKRQWTYSNTIDFKTNTYDSKHGSVKWAYVDNFKVGTFVAMPLKSCLYKIRDTGGKPIIGTGGLNFLESKYKQPKKTKTFNFSKLSDKVTTENNENNDPVKKKFNLRHLDFTDERNEFDPVNTNTTDSSYLFDNADAIVVNLNNKKKKS